MTPDEIRSAEAQRDRLLNLNSGLGPAFKSGGKVYGAAADVIKELRDRLAQAEQWLNEFKAEKAALELQLDDMREKLDALARVLLEDPKSVLSTEAYAALDAMIETYLKKPKGQQDGLQLGERRDLPYPKPISDDDAKKKEGV